MPARELVWKRRVYDLWNSCEIREHPDRKSKICYHRIDTNTNVLKSVRNELVHTICAKVVISTGILMYAKPGTFPTSQSVCVYVSVCVCICRVEKSTANKQNRNSHRGTHTFRATFQYICFAITTTSYMIRRYASSNAS